MVVGEGAGRRRRESERQGGGVSEGRRSVRREMIGKQRGQSERRKWRGGRDGEAGRLDRQAQRGG